MKPGLPWSVKGIVPDAREAAKQAARRSGMTLGEWLNSTILEQADGSEADTDMVERAQRRVAAQSSDTLERTASRLEDIAESLARLSLREGSTTQRLGIQPRSLADDNETMNRILSRVESNERQTVEAFTAVNERLTVMSRQLAQAVKARDTRPEDSPAFQALEKAVRNIVEHMEGADKRNREQIKSLQERIATLSNKAQSSANMESLKQAPALSQLEARIADLARRIEQSENRQPNVTDMLRGEISSLAGRIDQVRDTAESLAAKAQTQAVQASQRELKVIEERILGLIREAQSSLLSSNAGPTEMQRLRGEIEKLNQRIDSVQAKAQDNGDVRALHSAVEQLSTRVAQGPDLSPITEMENRILEITQRLEQQQTALQQSPQLSSIESKLAELEHRFAQISASPQADAEIEQQLMDVNDRVARTERHLSSLETIERAVNQLFESLEQQRKWTEDVAEQAAGRMAQQLQAQMQQPISLQGSPEIKALEEGLHAVREAAEASDHRNQETLEAVHETLEQIVAKLAELETAAISQRVAAAVAEPLPSLNLASTAAPLASPSPLETAGQSPFAAQPTETASEPVEPAAPSFSPFEAATPQPPAASAAGDDIFHSIGSDGRTPFAPKPAATPAPPVDDFIAAARRAAQATASQRSLLHGIAPGAARFSEESSKKLLSFSLFKRRKKEPIAKKPIGLVGEIKHPPGFKPANKNSEKRRKLMIYGLVLLAAAVAAFSFKTMGSKTKAVKQPVAIEQKIDAPAKPAEIENQGEADGPAVKPDAAAVPKPAELESSLDRSLGQGGLEPDPLLTGSTGPAGGDAQISALVSGEAPLPQNMPPSEVGSLKLREAAALGNPGAQFLIATRYLNGEGVNQDYAKAAYWFGKAAAQGSAPAQYRVATLYEKGKGVARDLKAAQGWYERAASLGNVKAMHNAAVLAAGNQIGAPDYSRAFKWFSLGAAHGLKDSQFNLAVLLERGLGTEANPADAMFWYSLAAQQNDEEAQKRAEALAKKISPDERKAVLDRIARWHPEQAPEVANTVAINKAEWGLGAG